MRPTHRPREPGGLAARDRERDRDLAARRRSRTDRLDAAAASAMPTGCCWSTDRPHLAGADRDRGRPGLCGPPGRGTARARDAVRDPTAHLRVAAQPQPRCPLQPASLVRGRPRPAGAPDHRQLDRRRARWRWRPRVRPLRGGTSAQARAASRSIRSSAPAPEPSSAGCWPGSTTRSTHNVRRSSGSRQARWRRDFKPPTVSFMSGRTMTTGLQELRRRPRTSRTSRSNSRRSRAISSVPSRTSTSGAAVAGGPCERVGTGSVPAAGDRRTSSRRWWPRRQPADRDRQDPSSERTIDRRRRRRPDRHRSSAGSTVPGSSTGGNGCAREARGVLRWDA